VSVLDKARQTAKSAADIAAERGRAAAGTAGRATAKGAAKAADWGKDPETHDKARRALEGAGRQARRAAVTARHGVVTVIERIEPGTLADLIIRATAIQEKTNEALRRKGSRYRVSEVGISASIPPGINFTIGRLEDDGEVGGVASTELVGLEPEAPVLSLDGAVETLGNGSESAEEDEDDADQAPDAGGTGSTG
jgi:hypothetical protein